MSCKDSGNNAASSAASFIGWASRERHLLPFDSHRPGESTVFVEGIFVLRFGHSSGVPLGQAKGERG